MKKEIKNLFQESINDVEKMVQLNLNPDNIRFKLLRNLYEQGVDIKVILTAIFSVILQWYEKTGFMELEVDFSTILNSVNKKHNQKAKVIKNAIRTLLQEIKIPPDNSLRAYAHRKAYDKIVHMQTVLKECEPAIEEYLKSVRLAELHPLINLNNDDYLNEIKKAIILEQRPHLKKKFYNYKQKGKGKATSSIKLTQSTQGVWNECIATVVDELKRVCDSERQSYIKTGELLNTFYPAIYTDSDPDLVRHRYKSSK